MTLGTHKLGVRLLPFTFKLSNGQTVTIEAISYRQALCEAFAQYGNKLSPFAS